MPLFEDYYIQMPLTIIVISLYNYIKTHVKHVFACAHIFMYTYYSVQPIS